MRTDYHEMIRPAPPAPIAVRYFPVFILFFIYKALPCYSLIIPPFFLYFFLFLRRPITPSPDKHPFSTDTSNTQTPGNRKKGGNELKHNTGTMRNASRNREIALKKGEEERGGSQPSDSCIYFVNPTFARMLLLFAALSSKTPRRVFHTVPGSWDASIPFQIPFAL